MPDEEGCWVPHCDQKRRGRKKWCNRHRQRVATTGTWLDPAPEGERFWTQVNITQGCWEWAGDLSSQGYGRFSFGGVRVAAHRRAYEMAKGAIPEGLVVDHFACDNPPCVRPDHLKAVTQGENVKRGGTSASAINMTKTHCPQGHEYDEENTYVRKNGGRQCRACDREHQATKYHARKAAV